jgi:curved DNA-binding protein CbpA
MAPAPNESKEDVDLDAETRAYVLAMHGRLEGLSHYEMLGIPRAAEKKAVKRAYFDAVGMIHPDRYFGKKLGPYKLKMEQIFARLSEAYETLLSPEKRTLYDATLDRRGSSTSSAPPPAIPKAPVDPRALAQRQAAMEALKQRYFDSKAKAQRHAEAGHRARARQDFAAAAEAYRTALSFSPDDRALEAAYNEARQAAETRIAESYKRQAELEEHHGHWAEASESWKRVLLAQPGDGEAQQRLDLALAHAGRGGSRRTP